MSTYNLLLVLILSTLIGCKGNSSKEEIIEQINPALINTKDSWRLTSPQTGSACELLLSFDHNNKMHMNFRGELFEGYYEIDSMLTHYISINIFNKHGWDDECPVNPEYLTLYESDTQFLYTIIDNKLYFQKAEKAIVFERVSNQNI